MSTSLLPGTSAWLHPRGYSKLTCGGTIEPLLAYRHNGFLLGVTDPDEIDAITVMVDALSPDEVRAINNANGRRVRLAAGAIQQELAFQGFLRRDAKHDGHFGPLTDGAIRDFQEFHGYDAKGRLLLMADGVVGPKTMRWLCWPVLLWEETGRRIPDRLVMGMIRLESSFDPGAQGRDRTRSTDRGLAQISDESFAEVSDAEAYGDIRSSIRFAAAHLRAAYDGLVDAEPDWRWDAAVAHHNNPSKAREWARTGAPPDAQIAAYVSNVRRLGALPL